MPGEVLVRESAAECSNCVPVPGITPLIITYNEELNIGRVLEKLRWAREIVIVDSFSTDRTLEIAAAAPNVTIYQRTFDHFASQLNFGLTKVRTPWVLTMDADYVLTDELIAELAKKASSLDKDGYSISFRYCVAGKPLRGSLYPPRVALLRKERCSFIEDGHAQGLRLDGEVGKLNSMILHDDRKPLSAWLHAQDWYETLEVQKLTQPGATDLSLLDRARQTRWLAPVLVAVYCLFFRGLILEGKPGLFYTLQRTYTELLLSIKLLDNDLKSLSSPRDYSAP